MTFDTATAKSGTLQRKGRSVQIEAEKNFDNRHKAQQLKHLPSGATVYITDMDCTGTVIQPSKKPRSYLVDTLTTVVKSPVAEHSH